MATCRLAAVEYLQHYSRRKILVSLNRILRKAVFTHNEYTKSRERPAEGAVQLAEQRSASKVHTGTGKTE